MKIDQTTLNYSLFGVLLISIGLISVESFTDRYLKHKIDIYGLFAPALLFIVGWIIFFITQYKSSLWIKGIPIPLIAIIGQLAFLLYPTQKGSKINPMLQTIKTLILWMIFMIAWFYYAYNMTFSCPKNNYQQSSSVNPQKALYVYSGLVLLMLGMIGYFFERKHDWHQMTGGIVPRIDINFGIFSPFVVLIGFGWATIALGHSII